VCERGRGYSHGTMYAKTYRHRDTGILVHRDTDTGTQGPDNAEAKDTFGGKIKDDVADVHNLERKHMRQKEM